MKHVAVMGYGTVGSGVYEVLTKNKEVVSKNVGEELNVKYVLDLREFPGDPVENVLTHNFDDILNAENIIVFHPIFKLCRQIPSIAKSQNTLFKFLSVFFNKF